MNPRVKSVVPLPNYQLEICFQNGEVKIYDCSGLLDFGIFEELKDQAYFQQAQVLDGTVFWPNEQDICPDTLYLDSIDKRKMA